MSTAMPALAMPQLIRDLILFTDYRYRLQKPKRVDSGMDGVSAHAII